MASNSTKLIADMKSVITNGPKGTTAAKAAGGTTIPGAGPIMDYQGICQSVLLNFERVSTVLGKVITNTAAGDSTNLSKLTGVYNLLLNLGSTATTALADLKACAAAGPNADTLILCTAPAGPIMDWTGSVNAMWKSLQECAILIGFHSMASGAPQGSLLAVTDASGDATNRNLLLGMSQVLL